MARSYDIAELMTNDGEYITDSVRRKINGNFRRICQMMQQELPSQQQQQLSSTVTAIVGNVLETALPEMQKELFDQLAPVGSVIVTYTSSDPRLSHGTWEQIGGGRYVRAAGGSIAVGDAGGSNEIELTAENLPASQQTYSVDQGTGYELSYLQPTQAGNPVTIEPEYIALLFYRRTA